MAPKRKAAEALDTPEKQASQKAATYDAKIQKLQIDLEAIECTVCTEVITPPIKMCANSHIMCAQCTDKCKSRCPQCREEVSMRNRALEKMVEKLVVPCRYKASGCPAEFLGATVHQSCLKATRHAEDCAYAPLKRCPCQKCPCVVSNAQGILDMKQHLLAKPHAFPDKGDMTNKWQGLNSPEGLRPSLMWVMIVCIRGEDIAIQAWLDEAGALRVSIFRLKSAVSAKFPLRVEFTSKIVSGTSATRVVVELPDLPNARDISLKHVLTLPTSLFDVDALPDKPQNATMSFRMQ